MMSKDRIIFHIDVNNAFLSWTATKLLSEGFNIDIRKIPSVIAGDENKRHGIVLAKSPIAKKYGIKTAETLYLARKKCPKLKVFPPDHEYYVKMSKKLFDYLYQFTPDIEIFSIDECFLDMTNTKYLYNNLLDLAYKIKDEIYDKFGFTVNIGVANNKLCAKMASDFEKPNKVHTLYEDEIEKKIWPLDVSELFMIGKSTSEKLRMLGINTIGELAQSDILLLRKHFKNQAVFLKDSANGKDDSPVEAYSDSNKCLSVSETFEADIKDINKIKSILLGQVYKISENLRSQNLYTQTVAVTIKTYDFKNFSKQRKLYTATNSSKDIYINICDLFEEIWDGTKVRNIGVRLSNFVGKRNKQVSIFDGDDEGDDKIDYIIDNIKDKYGCDSITIASLMKKDN